MNIEALEREGYIRRLPIDKRKIEDSLLLAKRDISTAKNNLHHDIDWAFSIAYNSILQSLRALMFLKGFRPSGSNQHFSVVRFAELFLEEDMILIFDRMRRKRHISVYDTAGTISKHEAEDAIVTAEKIHKIIKNMIHKKL